MKNLFFALSALYFASSALAYEYNCTAPDGHNQKVTVTPSEVTVGLIKFPFVKRSRGMFFYNDKVCGDVLVPYEIVSGRLSQGQSKVLQVGGTLGSGSVAISKDTTNYTCVN